MNKNFLSFSKTFKIQYYSSDKKIRDEVDNLLKSTEKIIQFMKKEQIPFQKIKLRLKIKTNNEQLILLIFPVMKIIVKGIDRT